MIIFNYNPEDIISSKHICYFISGDPDPFKITLSEIVELTLNHPEAPGHATITTLSINWNVATYNRINRDGGHVVLLEASQNTCKVIENKK